MEENVNFTVMEENIKFECDNGRKCKLRLKWQKCKI